MTLDSGDARPCPIWRGYTTIWRKPAPPDDISSAPRRSWKSSPAISPRLLLTLATCEYTGQDEFDGEIEFPGRRLPYSHDRRMATLGNLAAAGLVVISTRLIETGGETFFWVIARRPSPL